MLEAVEAAYAASERRAQKHAALHARASSIDAHPKVAPRADELVGSHDASVPGPLCPSCGNLDPRALLDDSVLEQLGKRNVSTPSITVVAEYASSGWAVFCHACGTDFHFCPRPNPFELSGSVHNTGKCGVAYLTRILDGNA